MTARYLSRRIGRSQNGRGGCFSVPFPLAGPPPAGSAGGAGGAGAGVGLGAIADRCRGPAPDHPVEGQAGAGAAGLGAGAGRGAAGPEEAGAGARARVRCRPFDPAERPAPRDQPEAALDDPAGPEVPARGGRSRGGAVRPAPSVSGMLRTEAPAPVEPAGTGAAFAVPVSRGRGVRPEP